MFITEDSDVERGALRAVWPNLCNLCAYFIIYKAGGWDTTHGISKEDQYPIMALICKLVYNDNETDMERNYLVLMNQDHPDSYILYWKNV